MTPRDISKVKIKQNSTARAQSLPRNIPHTIKTPPSQTTETRHLASNLCGLQLSRLVYQVYQSTTTSHISRLTDVKPSMILKPIFLEAGGVVHSERDSCNNWYLWYFLPSCQLQPVWPVTADQYTGCFSVFCIIPSKATGLETFQPHLAVSAQIYKLHCWCIS